MKEISRIVVKMPLIKGNVSIRYEISLRRDGKFYKVMWSQFRSGKLVKCEPVAVSHSIEIAIKYYNEEMLVLTDILTQQI